VIPKGFASSIEVLEEGFSTMIASLSRQIWKEHHFEWTNEWLVYWSEWRSEMVGSDTCEGSEVRGKNYLTHDLVISAITSSSWTMKVSFLRVLSKDVQWSFKVGIMELLRESWATEVGDGLSYDFKLGY